MVNLLQLTTVGQDLEMYKLEIQSSVNNYEIVIESGADKIAIKDAFIADKNIAKHIDTFNYSGVYVEADENLKNLKSCEEIILRLNDLGLTKSDQLVAIGGGFVQDLSTLVTSLYMRGIPWTYFPTTLMSMMDSCVGGKSAINAGNRKNLIGNFYPPSRIVINTKFIDSLQRSDLINGLAEAVKICFAKDSQTFEQYLSLSSQSFPENNEKTAKLINLTLSTKKWFVEVDEFDLAERKLLNFGHTFAHAIESATDFAIPHGIAVAIGMLSAIAHPESAVNENTKLLKEYSKNLLKFEHETVHQGFKRFSSEKFKQAILRDKKNSNSKIRLILPSSDQMLTIVEIDKDEFNLELLTNLTMEILSES